MAPSRHFKTGKDIFLKQSNEIRICVSWEQKEAGGERTGRAVGESRGLGKDQQDVCENPVT